MPIRGPPRPPTRAGDRVAPASRASTPILALPHTGEGISPALSNPVPEAELRKSGRRLGHVGGEQDVLAAFIAECCVDHRKHTNRDTFRTMPSDLYEAYSNWASPTSALASADPRVFRSPARFSVTISRGRPNSRVISRHLAVARATFYISPVGRPRRVGQSSVNLPLQPCNSLPKTHSVKSFSRLGRLCRWDLVASRAVGVWYGGTTVRDLNGVLAAGGSQTSTMWWR